MFNRVDDLLIITVNNLQSLELLSVWIFNELKVTYFINTEIFPECTLYQIGLKVRKDWDKKIEKKINKLFTGFSHKMLE